MALKESMTSFRLAAMLGQRIAQRRLSRNITQKTLAHEAGVSLRTLRRLEAGQPTSLDTFLRVAITLELTGALLAAVPEYEIRPMELIRLRGKHRQRARARKPRAGKPGRPIPKLNLGSFTETESG